MATATSSQPRANRAGVAPSFHRGRRTCGGQANVDAFDPWQTYSVLRMPAFGRGQRRPTGNLVGSPAPDRVSVGPCFKRRPGLAMRRGFGVTTARTERSSFLRIERIGNLDPCGRRPCGAQRIGNGGDKGLGTQVVRSFED